MHMADALISPAVGGTMLAVSGGILTYSIKKIKDDMDDKKVPLMGVMGAFIFAAQMINFTIPGTGSSGHIGGGMLLSILLGPYAGFLTLTSILLIQALFFADGGLLALGCNIINMGLFTCFIAYPLIYKKTMKKIYTSKRIFWASLLSCVLGLQLGAFSVTLETLLSGKTELPFLTFVSLMQPIHLAIGIVEGLITAAITSFIYKYSPELLHSYKEKYEFGKTAKKTVIILLFLALVTGGFLSWFASEKPDGLEWSTQKVTGQEELENTGSINEVISNLQNKIAILPDYSFKKSSDKENSDTNQNTGTTVSGIAGGILTILIISLPVIMVKLLKRKPNSVIKQK